MPVRDLTNSLVMRRMVVGFTVNGQTLKQCNTHAIHAFTSPR